MSSNFSQLLRPIGEALMPLHLESFKLRLENEAVYISAQKREEAPPPVDTPAPSMWDLFRRKKVEAPPLPRPALKTVDLRYSYDDIARMDAEGKSRRVAAGERPDPHALSQILRAAGAFIDQKQGRLLGVTMADHDVAIEYESALKQKSTDKHTVVSLYDYWVKMYLRRRERA